MKNLDSQHPGVKGKNCDCERSPKPTPVRTERKTASFCLEIQILKVFLIVNGG